MQRPVRLAVFGYADTIGSLNAVAMPRSMRVLHSVGALAGGIAAAVPLAFVPPHIPWILAALGTGIYFARRFWRGEYRVESFEGSCPRCSTAVPIGAGTRVSFPTRIACFGCHQEVTIDLANGP